MARSAGLEAERLAEGGSKDLGDIRVWGRRGPWVIEAKHRTNLNVHSTLARTQTKADPIPAVVVWKKLSRKGDNTRRTADGPPVVVMALDVFWELIGG